MFLKGEDESEPSLNLTEAQESQQVIPLFQVTYDRTLCKPLGTILDFKSLKIYQKNKKDKKAQRNIEISRSSSPVDTYMPFDNIEHLQTEPAVKTPEEKVSKESDVKQNALTLFEFTTVYPFVFSYNKFKCFVCSEPFHDPVQMKHHMDEKHTFVNVKRLVNNRTTLIKVDVSDITCKLCLKRFDVFDHVKIHLKQEHDKEINITDADNLIPFKLCSDEDNYRCVVCNEIFLNIRLLIIHMSTHFSNYSCEVCGSTFVTLRLLKRHLEVHLNGNFPCERCDKIFSTASKRAQHIRGVHLKFLPRRCPLCPERFNSNYRRTLHLQDVHNQSSRVHKCKTCGRGFNLKYHLTCHIRSVHLQERNHICDVCQARFSTKETLKRHRVIHTGEKNHKCDICGVAFMRRKNLNSHLRLHNVIVADL